MHTVIHNYTRKPEPLRCSGSVDYRELRFARAMTFAIAEINNSSVLLPGVTLGYQIHDSCASVPVAVQAAFQLVNGHAPEYHPDQRCSQSGMVMGIVGESGSTPSISMSRVVGPFNIPQVSHFATCACLSDKQQYPSFFRTIPSDKFQADALVRLVKQFGWTWIGTVYSDSDYGNNGMASFLSAAQREGICVEYSEAFYRKYSHSQIQKVAQVIRSSTATVVVAFAASGDMRILLQELCQEPVPYRQWVGSEAWVTDPDLLRFSSCVSALGLGIQQSVIPGLETFLLDLPFITVSASPLLSEFWEEAFKCRMPTNARPDDTVCDGSEDLVNIQNPYTDTSQLRITNMVYKAVYAVAYAIHSAVCPQNTTCQPHPFIPLQSTQVFAQLKKVNFSLNGYTVSFDANGDPVATYELVNWQTTDQGPVRLVTVGHFDASQPKGQEFRIQKVLQWMQGTTQVPMSVCSQSCVPGTRKVLHKGKPICCYDCIACPEGEISNITDSPNCHHCPEESWPNLKRDSCLPKSVEFLSFSENLGIILIVFSVGGACLAILTATVFFQHRNTPIVKANNSELSFWLLLSLTLCFLCSLTFIGTPSEWSCMLRHTAFGITFVLCISCVLGKTIVVLIAFRATLPGSNVMKWFGPSQQRLTVASFTLIQVLICIIWLVVNPPFPINNLTTYKDRIILECALGSPIGFWAVLGYIGLLALLCFVLAFLARKLPDNFNEAKLITFSMLIFCAVWITFIPAYVSSPGKFTVAVEIFAILASSFGLFFCLFLPRCYIILFKPEKNTKKYLMSK
ncbi:extracellular calcium-sensing receptor-like [Eucyclogobius newberryi]|uniref:extracellular calcium-sensing receptor-like n=1 Tax=Eucyclogobius newberryi TaxID=166745 RepID=UPI003B5ADDA0